MKRLALALFFVVLFSECTKADGIGPRPGRWCGWFMQHDTGVTSKVTGRNLNMAREWANVGSNAGGPGIGVVVVWRHHVGKIVGQDANGKWLVKSGNDGGRVRVRARSLKGVFAYRNVGGSMMAQIKSDDLHGTGQEEAQRSRVQNLMTLAVERRRSARTLRQARAVAPVAHLPVAPVRLAQAVPFTDPTYFANEVGAQHSQAVVKRQRVARLRGHVVGPRSVVLAADVRSDPVHMKFFGEEPTTRRSSRRALRYAARHEYSPGPVWGEWERQQKPRWRRGYRLAEASF